MTDYLMHYGVKGMKWGIRHDPVPSANRGRSIVSKWERNSSTPKKQSEYQRRLSIAYQNGYGISEKEADEYAHKKAKAMKYALVGVAAVSSILAGVTAYKYHKYINSNEVLKAGTKIQTLQADPDLIKDGKKFYAAHGKLSNQKYLAYFSKVKTVDLDTGQKKATGELKKKITTKVKEGQNLKIAGRKDAAREYHALRKSDPEFRNLTRAYTGYKQFNTYGLLGPDKKEAEIFGRHMNKKGFAGVKDINDRLTTGFNTKADIYFGKSGFEDFQVSDISEKQIKRAKKKVNGDLRLRAWSTPSVLATASIAGIVIPNKVTNTKIKRDIKRREE